MKRFLVCLMIIAFLPALANADVQVGNKAPDFSLPSSIETTVKLSDFAGKIVVLEWTNHECPFVKKHYDTKNMQKLQARAKEQGVVWLSIVSSAPGKQGHVTAKKAEEVRNAQGAASHAVLLDESGAVGKVYGAKTTPHMFVINKEGTLAYMGAIDDIPSGDKEDVTKAKVNYVTAALDALLAGKPVEVAVTNPYGCSVKYE